MSPSYTRLLFRSGAIFNWLVGLPFLIALKPVAELLGLTLNPAAALFIHVTMGLVIAFGWVYWLIARDSVRYRLYILLGMSLKIMVVTLFCAHWLNGGIPWQLPALASGDTVYALLFWMYYQRTA